MSTTPSLSEGCDDALARPSGFNSARRFTVHFNPVKWWIRGQHQPAISYTLWAVSPEAAKAEAIRIIRREHSGVSYRFHAIQEIGGAVDRCSVCGGPAIIYGGAEPNFCPEHCPDHDYADECGEWLCKTCGQHRPDDWGDWEDTSISGDASC